MPRRDEVGSKLKSMLSEYAELDFFVAHDIGIGSEPVFVAIYEVIDHITLVFGFVIPDVQIYAELDGDAQPGQGRAVKERVARERDGLARDLGLQRVPARGGNDCLRGCRL